MTGSPDPDTAKTGRTVALVIAGAGLLSIFAPVITGLLGLPIRFEMLLYLISLGAFIWSLLVTVRMWQKTRK